MSVIGVTNEPASKISPFITQKGIEYVIAIGGASGYRANGIPHAWLVDSSSNVVWDGHPASLTDEFIEQNLRSVRLTPEFKLPKQLKKASADLNRGNFGKGIKSLQSYLKKPKDKEVAAAAKKAIKKAMRYGKGQYKNARDYAKEGHYVEAMSILSKLEKSFKGTVASEKAKKLRTKWKKDKKVKAEIEASTYLAKADALIRKKNYKAAKPLLQRVIKSKKYADTKCRERAVDTFKRISNFL